MTSVVQLLLSRASSIDDTDPPQDCSTLRYYRPLYEALKYGNLKIVQMLVKAGASVNHPGPYATPALFAASQSGSYEKVKWLLDQGADINAMNHSGSALQAAARAKSKGVLELLLQSSSDVNAKDHINLTALTLAAQYGFLEGTKLLLDAGASINATDGSQAALEKALFYCNKDVVRLLLQSGADPNPEGLPAKKYFENIWGKPIANWDCEIFKWLLDAGLKVGIEDWRYIYEWSSKEFRQLDTKDRGWFEEIELERLKSFLKFLEALPQWQAVKNTLLPK
jgi:ankyrin repeat protein